MFIVQYVLSLKSLLDFLFTIFSFKFHNSTSFMVFFFSFFDFSSDYSTSINLLLIQSKIIS